MQLNIEIVPTVPTGSAEFCDFMDQLAEGFPQKVPLIWFDYMQTATTPLMSYGYSFEAVDRRTWKQVVEWPGGFSADPSLSLPSGAEKDRWRVPELQSHIQFRETIFVLTRKFGITELHLKWEA